MYQISHENPKTNICYISSPPKKDDLHVIEIGHNFPPNGYQSNRWSRNCYVLHYVVTGTVVYNGQTMKSPCMFLLVPNQIQFYQFEIGSKEGVCEQFWIMFSGKDAKDYLANSEITDLPICQPCSEIVRIVDLLQSFLTKSRNNITENDYFYSLSILFQLFSLPITQNEAKPNNNAILVQAIRNYIHDNFATIKSEDELAALVHLSTNHMHKIFKKEKGVSPIRYLNQYRIDCAKRLLSNRNDLSINDVSEMLGFSNPNYFCNVFKKYCNGISPRAYRNQFNQGE